MGFDDRTANCQTQPNARFGRFHLAAHKHVEQLAGVIRRKTLAAIGYFHLQHPVLRLPLDLDECARRRILGSVLQHIAQHTLDEYRVKLNQGQILGQIHPDRMLCQRLTQELDA